MSENEPDVGSQKISNILTIPPRNLIVRESDRQKSYDSKLMEWMIKLMYGNMMSLPYFYHKEL